MNAEQRKNIEKKIKEINDAIITQMAAEEKNSYDPEVTLPQNIEKTDITIKKAYDRSLATGPISRYCACSSCS